MPLRNRRSLTLLLLAFLCCAHAFSASAASLASLEKRLAEEQKKATERRNSLERLTKQERDVDAGLAATEKRILEMESVIESHQARVADLARDDTTAHKEYEALLAEQARTEDAQAETMRLLWEIACKRRSVGGREMADWAATDRDYAWSRELYAALEAYHAELDGQAARLAQVLGKREKLAAEMQQKLVAIEREKQELLQTRLEYSRRLTELRDEKASAKADLEKVLRLVENLNFQMEQAGTKIENLKGRLPRPAQGRIAHPFSPPDSRGIGIATAEGTPVQAVAGGTVVHNAVLRGFGTVLILQHGAEYYSLYAFLGSSPLKVGSSVQSRDRVGTTGYYPALNGPGLYFELRFKQKAINPEEWLTSQ